MSENRVLGVILAFSILPLFYAISNISIGYYEALLFFEQSSILSRLVGFSCELFWQNDWALRLPLVVIHLASVVLLYKVSKPLLKRKLDRVLSVVVFILLPGVNASAILLNNSSLVIFLSLLFIWFYQNNFKLSAFMVLIISLFIDNSFAILYLALFFYAIFNKENSLIVLCLALFAISMSFHGFDSGGRPRGHFLDTMGVYAAVFSPLVFIYYVYVMYRILIKERKEILWYVVFTAFMFSFLLSFRQQLILEDFLPFVVLGVPLMVRTFFSSFRVRLPQNRKYHAFAFALILSTLALSYMTIFINKPLYTLSKNEKRHFAYNYHIAKELSDWLKQKDINIIHVDSEALALRLRFYGIGEGGELELLNIKGEKAHPDDFLLQYYGKTVAHYRLYRLYELND